MRKYESDSDSDDVNPNSAPPTRGAAAAPMHPSDDRRAGDESPESPLAAAARQHRQVESLTEEVVMQALADLHDHRVQWELHRKAHHQQYNGDFSAVDIVASANEATMLKERAEAIKTQIRDASRAHAMQQERHRREEEHLIAEINHLRVMANARR
jgi:hypothetical protein